MLLSLLALVYFSIISSVLSGSPSLTLLFLNSINTLKNRILNGHLWCEQLFASCSLFISLKLTLSLVQGLASFASTQKLSECELGRRVGIVFRKCFNISVDFHSYCALKFMLSGKAILFSSLETLSANNKDIQIYAEKQVKHATFSSLLVWKKHLHKISCRKKFLCLKFEVTFLLYKVSAVQCFL